MPNRLSFSNTFRALENAISITQRRHSVLGSNIANLDTPGYKAKDIDFQKALSRAMESENRVGLAKTDPGHIGLDLNRAHHAEAMDESGEWNGFNWVDIDREMTKLTENNLIYRAAVETLLRKIATLKEVIREGGR